MKRKLIRQGKGALTISLPKKWTDFHELNQGQELEVQEDEADLIIKPSLTKKVKKTTINLSPQTPEAYRSIIGALYRGGYDEINVKFSDKKIIPNVQKAIDSVYGLEVLDIDNSSCTIKCIHTGEATEIEAHIRRIIYIISGMQETINEDLKKNKFNSKKELQELRNNVLKQRDLIIRIIKKQKLIDNNHFPYYNLVISLWNVARNYYSLYTNLSNKLKPSKEDLKILKKTEEYFNNSFNNFKTLDIESFIKRNSSYRELREETIKYLQKHCSLIASFCLNIIFSIQLADSSIYLLNHSD